MPFFERAWADTVDIATTPGLSGASISGDPGRALTLWHEFAASRGWIAGYIQLAVTADEFTPPEDDVIAVTNDVFVLDLTAPDPLAGASEIVGRKVRRAQRAGVKPVADRPRLATAMQELYPAAMRRVGASAAYDFAPGTLERWILDPSTVVVGAELGGSVEALSIFLVAGEHSEYHLNACTEEARDMTAWLIREAINVLRARGVGSLNLGGGIRRRDGVYQFKERFHGAIHPLRSVRQIYDPAAYETLCRESGVGSERSGWFPAYRRRSSTNGLSCETSIR